MRHTVTGELDPELFSEVERERHAAGLSRSAAIRQSLEWWIVQRREHGEERVGRAERHHRQVMNRLDYIVGMIREQEHAAKRNGERFASRSREDSTDGCVDGYAPREGRGIQEMGSEDEEPRRSALAEARKRARRRVE